MPQYQCSFSPLTLPCSNNVSESPPSGCELLGTSHIYSLPKNSTASPRPRAVSLFVVRGRVAHSASRVSLGGEYDRKSRPPRFAGVGASAISDQETVVLWTDIFLSSRQ